MTAEHGPDPIDNSTRTVTGRTVLRLVPWVRSTEHSATTGSVTFVSGSRVLRYRGGATRLLPLVLPRLDGRADLDTIVADLGAPQLTEPVMALCRRLLADGLAMEVDAVSAERGVELFDALAGGQPASRHVYVAGSAEECAAVAAVKPGQWRLSPVRLTTMAGQPWDERSCALVWVHDMNAPELAEWNELAYRRRLPWLAVNQFDGAAAVVGPYVEPPQTACFECYRRRRASHSPAGDALLDARPAGPAEGFASTTAVTLVLAALAVAMLHEWAAARSAFVPGAVRTVTFDEGLRVETEYVSRVPRCSACRPVPAAGRLAPWSEYLDEEP